MNYQGTSYKNFLINLPLLFTPGLVFGLLVAMTSLNTAKWIIASLGVLGLICTKPILAMCTKQLKNKKYSLAKGFRIND
jgi:uncharacterized membrane protein